MNISVYTPTHDLTYIQEAYRSLTKQTFKHWTWVIQPNGPVRQEHFPKKMQEDSRVKFCNPVRGLSVGALKGIAVQHCKGDLLVELDHDDFLVSHALMKIADTYDKTKAGFIYSDCVHFFDESVPEVGGTCEVFPEGSGWRTYPFNHAGKKYTVMRSFDDHPRALCEVYWSPNHVRVWSREAYDKAGGYDMSLRFADDHELIVQTYLAGVNFYHIEEPLYFYRRYAKNSFMLHQNAVRGQQDQNRDRYIYKLWAEWCRRKGLKMIDLGGAFNCPKDEGYLSLDIQNVEGVDLVADVTRDLPLEDGSVGIFRAVDFLEHLPVGKVVPAMNQLYKKLAHGGLLASMTPSVSGPDGSIGRGAFQDPTHCSWWSENNFFYFTQKQKALFVPEIQCRFQAVRLWTDWPTEDYHHKYFIPYVHADLMAIHGDSRVPGGVLI